jgi:hypothetical protein
MAYRGDPGDALDAPTAEGPLRLELAAAHVELTVADRRLVIADRTATLFDGGDRTQLAIGGVLVVARDVPREDLGVWIELPGGMRRLFGACPVSLLDDGGLPALRRLDAVAQRLRAHLSDLAGDVRRAVEIGRGLDKVLLADHGDRYAIYARRLFRGHARLALEIHRDGKVVVHDGKRRHEALVTSRFGVTVRGDYLRFADEDGADLARVAIPWIAPEDRDELARRIGQLVDRRLPG